MTLNDRKKKSLVPALVRLAISASLIVFIYSTVDIPALVKTLKDLSLSTILLLICMYTFGQVISCLLYTSPSPRDQRGSRMPSSA